MTDQPTSRKGSLWRSFVAVSWSFLGIRKSSEFQEDIAKITPLHVLGVGLVVHEALKNRVGRPRPVQVEQMGGTAPFVPVFTLSTHCERNCSFVSGHAAIGFSLMAWGMWAPWSRRKQWLSASIGLGAAIGLMRIAQGGHFLSDVLFAGWTIWLIEQSIRAFWLRWPA